MTGPLAPGLTEADFQQRVVDLCAWLRLGWHHETDSRKSRKGFPDLTIWGPRGIAFAELKTDAGRLSRDQREVLATLGAAGRAHRPQVLVEVWRPGDWARVNRVLYFLAGRPCPREYR